MKWSIALAALLVLGGVTAAGAVDQDRVTGTGDQIKGNVKEGVGDVTGNKKLQREGKTDKAKLDDGDMWPTAFALKELTPAAEARIAALVKKAVG